MPAASDARQARQAAIREILASETISNQLELTQRLEARGISSTQSSISRDLRDLRVVKLDGRYVPSDAPRTAAHADKATNHLGRAATMIRGVVSAGPNLLVVRTATGCASVVGLALDQEGWPEIVGTLAGDDTIFVATASQHAQNRLRERLAPFLPTNAPTTTSSTDPHDEAEVDGGYAT